MLNSCPDCDKPIRADALRCGCGWMKTDFAYRPAIACAFIGCKTPAVVRLKKPTGWANMCEFHYSKDNVAEAERFCAERGLDTTAKKIAFCKALFNKPRDPRAWMHNPKSETARLWRDEILNISPVEREPGADYEEDREPETVEM
jgi:hypothetical protein